MMCICCFLFSLNLVSFFILPIFLLPGWSHQSPSLPFFEFFFFFFFLHTFSFYLHYSILHNPLFFCVHGIQCSSVRVWPAQAHRLEADTFLTWAVRVVFRIWKTGANGVSLSSI